MRVLTALLANQVRQRGVGRGLAKTVNGNIIADVNRDVVGARLEENSIARIHELTVVGRVHATVIQVDLVEDLLGVTLTGLKDLDTVCVPVGRVRLYGESL